MELTSLPPEIIELIYLNCDIKDVIKLSSKICKSKNKCSDTIFKR